MSADDFDYDDDEYAESEEGEAAEVPAQPVTQGIRNWLEGRRGWVAIGAITLVQGIFALVMLLLRSDARPVEEMTPEVVQALAVEMLGHEVEINQVYQLLPSSGGRRMTVGLDIVLVLGQLPEERIVGADRPTPDEFEAFMAAIGDMEPRIRSRLNSLLQRIPAKEYGSVEVLDTIKADIGGYVNDALEGLDFGSRVRPGIGKRRVTEVLLPMFVRQTM